MADKIRFILHNHSDSATMAATTEETNLPIGNVQLISRSSIWRSTAGTAQTITGTFGSAQTISAVCLGRHNLTENSTVVFSLHSGAAGGGTTLATSGTITVSAEQAYSTMSDVEFPDLKNIGWFNTDGNGDKIDLTNVLSYKIVVTGSGMSYIDVGRIIAGDYIEPTYNISYGHNLTWEDNTKQYRTDAGSLRSDIGIPYKKFSFNLKTISEADRVILGEAFADVGKRKDFFLSMFPENSSDYKVDDYSGIVKLNKMPRYTSIQCDWLSSTYSMEEV